VCCASVCDLAAVVDVASATTHLDPRTRTWYLSHHVAAAASGTSSSRADRRRYDWIDRKQKSKSFDFCWQSGLWSPIDRPNADVVGPPPPQPPLAPSAGPPVTAVVTAAATATGPPATTEQDADECRRTSPRLKLPPMFHMDSGSSFESYEPGDGLLQHQLLKVFIVISSTARTCCYVEDQRSNNDKCRDVSPMVR